jgi:hypothetical protein
MVRQVLEVTLFTFQSSVARHSRRFNAAEDSTEMSSERDHHQREQRHCEISNTRREAFRAEAPAHPAEKEDEQSGSQRADHMQPQVALERGAFELPLPRSQASGDRKWDGQRGAQ